MSETEFVAQLKSLGISITAIQLEQLKKYYELLIEYNKVMNLTGITDQKEVYLKHFYDSATLNKVIDLSIQKSLCDVGSGAGFPGLVLKILFPNLHVTLVDSLNKRILFLEEVIRKLDLEKIEAIHIRAEEYGKNVREQYDVVTARAVAHLSILSEYCIPLVKTNKYFIPMKANIQTELLEVQSALKSLHSQILEVKEFNLPIEGSVRTLVKIQKLEPTPKKYPRKYADMKKNKL